MREILAGGQPDGNGMALPEFDDYEYGDGAGVEDDDDREIQ